MIDYIEKYESNNKWLKDFISINHLLCETIKGFNITKIVSHENEYSEIIKTHIDLNFKYLELKKRNSFYEICILSINPDYFNRNTQYNLIIILFINYAKNAKK